MACEACQSPTAPYDIVHYGSNGTGYRQLCTRCLNADIADRLGLDDFQNARLEPVRMIDVVGKAHEFHFRVRLFGGGVAVDAFELADGQPGGYQFQVIGDPEEELLALLGRLIEKMRRALAVRHLEESSLGPQVNDGNVVRGLVTFSLDDESQLPSVVIDGRELTWAEFGRIVSAYEGWQFKLEFRDKSEEV
jgi:hypothetical protein